MRTMRQGLALLVLSLVLVAAAHGAAGAAAGRLVFVTAGDGVSGRLEIASVIPDGTGSTRVTRLEPSGYHPRWTSDGKRLVFGTYDSFSEDGASWSMPAGGGAAVRLPGSAYAAPSPDGTLVADLGDTGLVLLARNGTRVRLLQLPLAADDMYDGPIVWSPDGRRVAVSVVRETEDADYVRVFVAPADGRTPARAVTPYVAGRLEYPMSFAPDGTSIALDVGGTGAYTQIVVARLDGSRRRLVARDAAPSDVNAWSPDSRQIAFVGRAGGIFVASAATGHVQRIAATHSYGREIQAIGLAWSPRGREVAFSDAGGVYAVDVARHAVRLITRRGAWSDPEWSPDGTRLVFGDSWDMFVVRADGSGLRQVGQALQDDNPSVSPDGSRIVFMRGARGLADPDRIDVYVVGTDGAGLRRIARGVEPAWAPDGRRIAYVDPLPADAAQAVRLRTGRVMVADVDTGAVRQVGLGTSPAWSADSSSVAFMHYAFATRDTWLGEDAWPTEASLSVVPLDTLVAHEVLRSSERIYTDPAWSPDGRSILLSGDTIVDVATGVTRVLSAAASADDVSWSPDGTRLLLAGGYPDVVAIVDVASGATTAIAAEEDEFHHVDAAWSPDGTHVAFVGCHEEPVTCDVYVLGANGSGRARVTHSYGIEGGLVWAAGG
jgi:TolB protein